MQFKERSNIVKVILGQCLTQVFDRALLVAMIWYVVGHDSQFSVALFSGFSAIPYFFALYFSSIVINKIGSLRVVYLADLVRAILLLCAYFFLKPDYSLFILCGVLFFSNCCASLFDPAILSLASILVPKSQAHRLIASLTTCVSVGAILGPVLAILVMNKWGLRELFLFSSLAYFVSGFLELFIKPLTIHSEDNKQENISFPTSYLKVISSINIKVGFFIIFSLMINFFFVPLQVFIPIYVHKVLGSSMSSYAHLQISMGMGAVLGSLFVGFLPVLSEKAEWLALGFYLLATVFYILLSLFSYFNLFNVFFIDFFMCAGNVIILSLYQRLSTYHQQPFIMSSVMFISVATAPLAMLLAGGLISYYPAESIVEYYAFLSCITVVLAFFVLYTLNSPVRFTFLKVRGRHAN